MTLIVHLRATYYRASFQGGDVVLPRCRMGLHGFVVVPGAALLSDDRGAVTCATCLNPPRAIARERRLHPKLAPRPPIRRPTVPAVVTTSPVPSIEIMREVAERAGLSVSDLKSACREHRIAHPRQEAMWEIRQRTRLSLAQIAHRFGLKDHTTARWGILQHQARLDASQGPSA